jgi:uncharacterized membrane protein
MLYGLALLPGIVAGLRALCSATLGAAKSFWLVGLVAGVIGAVVGTYGGADVRAHMAAAFGRDPPAAFIGDAGTIVLGLITILALR